jgi:hypothetical protein
MGSNDLAALAADAYIYGYPLVADVTGAIAIVDTGFGALKPAAANTFAHAVSLAGPADKFVSVNNDTIYSIATVDLSGGPVLFGVPDTAGRYYVMQFVDAWSNNFAYVGRRATGTAAGQFLLASSDWAGPVPSGAMRINAPTTVFNIVGRIAVEGADELTEVKSLQPAFTLRPLEAGPLTGIPRPDGTLPEHLRFFDAMRLWMAAFPPPPAEASIVERFEPLGLLATQPPFQDATPALSSALADGLAAGKDRIQRLMKGDPNARGWRTTRNMFDYNADYLELGTIDTPEWKIADRQQAIAARAVAAVAGLWGNHAYEALYAFAFTDADGLQLNGAHRYEMTLSAPLPVDAFWSLTMYDTPDYYLVANPIERYSIGDRTPELRYGADGSLTVAIQHEAPDAAHRANWLPAPVGDFRPALRMYQPRSPLLDGSYDLPLIRRVD